MRYFLHMKYLHLDVQELIELIKGLFFTDPFIFYWKKIVRDK